MQENCLNNKNDTATNEQEKIIIIDAIMGSGKSKYVIEEIINKNPHKKFLCVVPTIDKLNNKNQVILQGEVSRYKKAINAETYEPTPRPTKTDDLRRFINKGCNIVTTHALIQKIDEQTMDLLKNTNYILIIDECLDVVHQYENHFTWSDLISIFSDEYTATDDKGFLIWNTDKEKKEFQGKYSGRWDDIKRLCNQKSLMCLRKRDGFLSKQIVMWTFPVKFFELFQECYICTYLWDGSIQKAYFDMHSIKYKHMTLRDNILEPYNIEKELSIRSQYKNLINIYNGETLNHIGLPNEKGKQTLTKSWFKNQATLKVKEKNNFLDVLKNNAYNYFRNIVKTKSKDNMFTSYIDYKKYVSGNGYTKGFIPCNCKGTNEFKNKESLAYLINLYPPKNIVNFFDSQGIRINQDLYALSELLQWIWRSRIRENKKINLYIPSKRMRTLLEQWFCGNI